MNLRGILLAMAASILFNLNLIHFSILDIFVFFLLCIIFFVYVVIYGAVTFCSPWEQTKRSRSDWTPWKIKTENRPGEQVSLGTKSEWKKELKCSWKFNETKPLSVTACAVCTAIQTLKQPEGSTNISILSGWLQIVCFTSYRAKSAALKVLI